MIDGFRAREASTPAMCRSAHQRTWPGREHGSARRVRRARHGTPRSGDTEAPGNLLSPTSCAVA